MKRLLSGFLAATFALLASTVALAQSQPSPAFVRGSPLTAAQLNSAFAGKTDWTGTVLHAANNLSDLQSAITAAKNLSVQPVKPLITFGPIGTSDDAATITAANNAIIAAKHSGGLIVEMPLWTTINSSVGLLADNNGGWECPIPLACTLSVVRANGNASTTYVFALNDPYATNVLLHGIKFQGNWNNDWMGTGSKAAWLGKEHGVSLASAFNGAGDSNYIANSTLGLQQPGLTVSDIYIGNFGGMCMFTQGAGANTYHNIRGENCGTYGLYMDGYDSKWSDVDFGSEGLSAIVCTGNCANNQYSGIKGWYAGQSQNPAHDHNLEVYGNSNNFVSVNLQDSSGDSLWEDNDFNNTFVGVVEWQGEIPWMDANVTGIRTGGGSNNHHMLLVSALAGGFAAQSAYPNVTAVVKDELSTSNQFNPSYSHLNTFNLIAYGFSNAGTDNNNYVFQPFWVIGPTDTTNIFEINGAFRQPRQWLPDPASGLNIFGSSMNTSAVGLVVDGPTGPFPGQVSLLAQTAGGQLASYNNTAVAAAGTLTATGNFSDGEVVVVGSEAWTMKSALVATPLVFGGIVSGTTLTADETTFHLSVGDLVYAYVPSSGTVMGKTTYVSGRGSCGASTCTYTLANYTCSGMACPAHQNMVAKFNQVHITGTTQQSLSNLDYAINALRPTVFRFGSQTATTLTITGGALNGLVHTGDYVTATDLTTVPYVYLTPEYVVSGTYNPNGTSTLTMSVSQSFSPSGPGTWSAQSGIVGTDYGYSVTPSSQVLATADATHLYVTALVAGVAGNSIGTTTTAGSASWGASTLASGAAGTQTQNNAVTWDILGNVNLSPSSGTQTRFASQFTPASASAACTKNTFTWDAGFFYMCTATNTWKRVAIATW